MLRRALVVALAGLLSGCTDEVEERHTDKLVSCSVSVPQGWRDALERNQLTSDTAVKIEAASPDGRATIVQTWGSELQLRLHTADGLRQPIAAGRGSFSVLEFDGRRVKFVFSKGNGEPYAVHTWDAETGAPPVRVDEKVPDEERSRHSDGTTSVWTEGHQLFARRADWPQQRLIAEIEKSHRVGHIWSPHVHGDFVSWSAMDSLYVTDLRTGSSVHSTKGYALSVVGGALVMFGKTVASSTPLSSLSPLPAC
jgi:hypothetical protein